MGDQVNPSNGLLRVRRPGDTGSADIAFHFHETRLDATAPSIVPQMARLVAVEGVGDRWRWECVRCGQIDLDWYPTRELALDAGREHVVITHPETD
jgi:hypothetical protein